MDKKCSQLEHKENDAISYCQECNLYMCNKCESHHSALFKKHNKYNLDKDIKEIFTGFCQQENHNKELKYYCKGHNKLCCAACITKIKDNENGQHKDCDVFSINEIKEEKKSKLQENIKYLENIYKNVEKYANDSKLLYEKITDKKDQIKTEIQKVFTKLRNELNNREDKLIEETDELFDLLFIKDEIIKNCEKLPNKIKQELEKFKAFSNNWEDNNNLKFLIYDSINLENFIKDIDNIYEIVKKSDKIDLNIKFFYEESFLLEKIKNFGIIDNNILFDNPSNIIHKSGNINFVIKQIKINNNIDLNENCHLKLLYRATKDGDSCKIYHQKTNDIPDTLTIIKTKEDIIFGGYTKIKIPSCYGKNFNDDKAFIFSLEYNKLYFPKKNNCSKHSNDNYGPIFGNNDAFNYPILIYGSNFFSTKNNSTCTKDCCYDNFEYDYELNKGKENFGIKEIEVYQVFFE